MSDISIPAMLDQVGPGRSLLFEASPERRPVAQRYIEVAPSTKRHGTAQHTFMTWTNRPDIQNFPKVGGIDRARTPLAPFTDIQLKFTGLSRAMLDCYYYTSDILFISRRLKTLIEGIDPAALESVRVEVDRGAALGETFFAVMPRRLLWAVDPETTNVKVENHEFLPGKFQKKVYYEGDVHISKDVPEDVHVFKDYGNVYWFWSLELLNAARAAGMRGMSVRRPATKGSRPSEMDL